MKADLIFVFGGREVRKRFGLELFREGVASRIVLSVARYDIRRFRNLALPGGEEMINLRERLPARDRHFFYDYDGYTASISRVPYYPLGTMREALALAGWLKAHPQVKSIALVSDTYHLPRVSLLAKRLLGPVRIELAAPVSPQMLQRPRRWPRLAEALKLLVYWAFLAIRTPRPLVPSAELFHLPCDRL